LDFDVADDAILFVEAADEADLDDADPLATRAGNTPDVAAVAVDRDDAAPIAFTGADPAADALLIDTEEAEAETLATAPAVAVERDDAAPEAVRPDEAGAATVFVDCWPIAN